MTKQAIEPEVITVDELASRCRIGRRQAYQLVRDGVVPGVIRLGKSIRISRQAVDRWLAGEPEDDDA